MKMGMQQKLEREYIKGMKFALNIATLRGIDDLKKEITIRESGKTIPLNVDHQELSTVAKMRAKDELEVVTTAIAYAIEYDMGLPPSVVAEFLSKFHSRVNLYRSDKEALEKANKELDGNSSFNSALSKYRKGE